jgi:ABC-type cobalamin/Fe3+-siderophores transport system ATPase subunit
MTRNSEDNSDQHLRLPIGELVDAQMSKIDKNDDNINELHSRLTQTIDNKFLSSDLHFNLNSINILVGTTGSGKTRLVFYEIAKLKYLRNPYTQFIYVTDEDNDKTYLKYKDLISIPIVKVKYKDIYEELSNTIKAKNMYETLIKKQVKVLTDAQMEELDTYLNAQGKDIVHTLVLFDDAINLFSDNPVSTVAGDKSMAKLRQLILKNRHHKITYFFNVHSYNRTSVPTVYKKNASCLFLFGGYSKLDFDSFYNQFRSPISKRELWDIYSNLSRRDVLLFNYRDDSVGVQTLLLS